MTPETVIDLSSIHLVHVGLSGLSVLEPTGGLPLHESACRTIIAQLGAQGETRTRTDFSTAPSRRRGCHYTTWADLVDDARFELATFSMSRRYSTAEIIVRLPTICPIIRRWHGEALWWKAEVSIPNPDQGPTGFESVLCPTQLTFLAVGRGFEPRCPVQDALISNQAD